MNISDLKNRQLQHTKLGIGTIVSISENTAIYIFNGQPRTLAFPDPFERAMSFCDADAQKFVTRLIELKKKSIDKYKKLFLEDDAFEIPEANYFFVPCNMLDWNMFESVKGYGHLESFYATGSMKPGDITLHYVGSQDKHYQAGCYAIGRVASQAYNVEKLRVDIEILAIDSEPIITKDEFHTFNKQFRTACKLKIDDSEILSKIWRAINKFEKANRVNNLNLYKSFASIMDILDQSGVDYQCHKMGSNPFISIDYEDGPIRIMYPDEDSILVSFSERCKNFEKLETIIGQQMRRASMDSDAYYRNTFELTSDKYQEFIDAIF